MRRKQHRNRVLVGVVGAAALATTGLIGGGDGNTPTVQAAAKQPEQGFRVFLEDFEQGAVSNDPPLTIRQYLSKSGVSYTASDYWADPVQCNGFIVSVDSVYQTGWCGGSKLSFQAGQGMSEGLNARFGAAGDKYVVFSETSAGVPNSPPFAPLQVSTGITIPVVPKRFYTGGYDTAVLNCQTGSAPLSRFELATASGGAVEIAKNLDGCVIGEPVTINQVGFGEREAIMARIISKDAYLVEDRVVGLNIYNDNETKRGNDGVYDNLQLFDVTPHLDKEFESPAMLGTTTTMRFTVTNTYGPDDLANFTYLGAKPNWSFTDQLPEGLEIVGTPTTGTGAEACADFDPSGTTATQFAATGSLVTDQLYCIMEVEVTASKPGEYTNLASDVDPTGLIPPDNAKVVFVEKALIEIDKTGTLNDLTEDDLGNTNDEIIYKFVVRNTGNSELRGLNIVDPLVGTITCEATTLPVGGSTNCIADKPYIVTQADTDKGEVVNQATANAVSAFGTAVTDLSDDPTDPTNEDLEGDGEPDDPTVVPLDQDASLALDKTAAAPVDVNNNGYSDTGDTIQFSFLVTNTGTVTVTDIVVTDPLVGSATCESTTLAAGQSTNCTADAVYVITADDVDAGKVVNTATSAGVDPDGKEVKSNEDSTTTPVQDPPIVVPPTTTTTTTVPPRNPPTGANVKDMVGASVFMVFFGGVVLVASRRRFSL